MKPTYGPSTVKRHRRTQAELAEVADAIVDAIEQDKPVTLRGVYYRVVSAGAVDKTENGYRLIGRELGKLRRSGRVSYADITDGTRWITKPRTHTGLDEMLRDAAASYRRSLWHSQPVDVHVFTEKDAISGVIAPITERWDVPLGVLRGYVSDTFAANVADSIIASGKTTYVYQLGDHDPSGLDSWRSFVDKVQDFGAANAHFERLAVTPHQIRVLGLPTRPTKSTDSRAKSFAGESVEVDAIPAHTLRDLLDRVIQGHIEREPLRVTRIAEDSERDILTRMAAGQET